MRRKALLALPLILLSALLTTVACQVPTPPVTAPAAPPPQKVFVWKGQSAYTAADQLHQSFVHFAKRVEEMSGGRLKIEVLPGGAIVPNFEVLEAVQRGVLDIGIGDGDYWVPKHPAGSLFASAPAYGMNQWDLLAWAYYGGGLELYREYIQEKIGFDNVEVFLFAPALAQPLGWFPEPVTSLEQFRRLKFRTPGLPAEVMKELGVSVTVLPGGEVVPALERGTIDAAEYFGPTADKQLGLHDVSKIYMMPSYLQPIGLVLNLLINKQKWEELPDDLKAIVRNAVLAESADFFMRYLDQNSKDLLDLVQNKGVKVVNPPPDLLKALLEGWDRVWQKYAQRDDFFARVLESQREFAKRVVFLRSNITPPPEIALEHYQLFK